MGIASACSSPLHFWSKRNKQNTEQTLLDLSKSLLIIARQKMTTSRNHHKLPQILQYQIRACGLTVRQMRTLPKRAKPIRNRNHLKPWFLLTAKLPNWATNCSHLHWSTSSVLLQCIYNTHLTPTPFESASQTAQSHTIATLAQHNFILWRTVTHVAGGKTSGASNPTTCRDTWRGSVSGIFR